MNLEYKDLLPEDFADNARVWIYQANRLFSLSEALQIEQHLENFIENWKAHGDPVKGFGTLFFGQFLILMADETEVHVSGCSTDSSVHFIKEIERLYNVQLFDRQMLGFVIKDNIQVLPMNQIDYALQNGFITGDTLYFNNTVLTKKELIENWLIPVKQSWLSRKLNATL